MDSNIGFIDKIQTNNGEFQVRDTTSYETSQQNKIDITKLQQLYVSLYNIVQQLVDAGMLDVSGWKDSFYKTNSSNIQPIYCDENGIPHKCDVDEMIIGTSKVTKKLENPINIVTNLETTDSVITDLSNDLTVPIQGVLPIENGGTGVDNQGDIIKNIAKEMLNNTNTIEDSELITLRSQNPTQKSSLYTKTVGKLWDYIKTKLQNVLGLTNTSYNQVQEITMVSLGFTKDSNNTVYDFWKKLNENGIRDGTTLIFKWNDVEQANINGIIINGGTMYIGKCGNANSVKNTFDAIYINNLNEMFKLSARNNDVLFPESQHISKLATLNQTFTGDVTGNLNGSAKNMFSKRVTIKTGSTSQSRINIDTLINWLVKNGHIITGNYLYQSFTSIFDYTNNDILQLTIGNINYELQLAGCIFEFIGNVDVSTATNSIFRLRIHSNPKNYFDVSSGYTKFPECHIAEFFCNGKDYSPTWKMLTVSDDLSNYTSVYVGSSQPDSSEPAKLWVQI